MENEPDKNGYESRIEVLYIDTDSPDFKKTKSYFKDTEFNVEVCENRDNAVKILSMTNFDAIVAGNGVPLDDALSLLRTIRDNEDNTPFIFFSGTDEEEAVVEALDAGADLYLKITKDPESQLGELSAAINRIVACRRREEALKNSEIRYRNIFENANDAIIVHLITPERRPGRIIDANKAAEEMLNYSTDELRLLSMTDIIEPETPGTAKKISDELFKKGRAIFESGIISKEGKIIPVEVSSNLSREDGEFRSITIIRDTTERSDLLNRLQMAIRGGELGTWDWDVPSGKVIFNERWARMLGYSPDEIKDDFDSLSKLLYPQDRERVIGELDKNLKGLIPAFDSEYRMTGKDGQIIWILSKGTVIERDKNGNPLRMVGTHHNITDIKEAEEDLKRKNEELAAAEEELRQQLDEVIQAQDELRENEAYIRTVLDNIPVGIAVNSVKPEVEFEYFNRNFLKYYRVDEKALATPDSFWENVYEDPKFREEIKKRILEDIETGDPELMHWDDIPIIRKGEKTTFISARSIPLQRKGLVISMVWDVTEQKRSDDRIRLHLLRAKSLLDLYQTADGREKNLMEHALKSSLSMTESHYGFIGLLSPDESDITIHSWSKGVMNKCLVQENPVHFPVHSAGIWAECIRKREPVIINDYSAPHPAKHGLPKGHVMMKRLLMVPIFDAGKITAIIIVANKERSYIDEDADALTTLGNLMWEIIKNQKAEKELKREQKLFLRTFESLEDAAFVLDEDPAIIRNVNEAAVKIFGYNREELVGKNISMLHIDKNHLKKFDKQIIPYIREHQKIPRFEFRMKRKDGTSFPTEHSISALFNYNKTHTGRVSIIRDITERKESEIREKEALRQIETNMEQLATLNDQIRNPLTVITGLVDLKCPKLTGEIMDQVNIIDEIVRVLDAGWIRSEKIWEFLKTHYGVGEEDLSSEFKGDDD